MRFCLPLQSEAWATFSSSCNLANLSVRDLKRDLCTLISPSLRQTASLIACCFFRSRRLNQISFRFNISSNMQTFRPILLTCSSNLISRSYSDSANSPLILSNSPARYYSFCDCICAICFCIDSFSTLQLSRSCSSYKLALLNLSVNSLLSTPALRIFYSCSFFLFIWVNCSSYSICCFSNKRAYFYDNNTYSQSMRVCSQFRISYPAYIYDCSVALLAYSSAALFINVFAFSSAYRRNRRSSLKFPYNRPIFLAMACSSGHSSLSSSSAFFAYVSGVILETAIIGNGVVTCCGVTREGCGSRRSEILCLSGES